MNRLKEALRNLHIQIVLLDREVRRALIGTIILAIVVALILGMEIGMLLAIYLRS